MNTRIKLSREAVLKCKQFARDCAAKERPEEWGVKNGHVRDVNEIAVDTFIGKIGEEAVSELLKLNGIKVTLDYEITPRGTWDKYDILYNGWGIDVKATKKASKYFFLEWNKIQFRSDAGELPHFFVLTRLDFAFTNLEDFDLENCWVECIGFVSTVDLNEDNPKVITVNAGEFIPGTKTKMTAKSFGIEVTNLDKNWDRLVSLMKNNEAYSLHNYKAPGVIVKTPGPSKEEKAQDEGPKYSVLISTSDMVKYNPDFILSFIKKGIKVLLFMDESKREYYSEIEKSFTREHFAFYSLKHSFKVPELVIYDGNSIRENEKLLYLLAENEVVSTFNIEQYEIEHTGVEQTLIIKASAGTGKTTVMIDRIMYLLAVLENVGPSDIGMITFTNKAAQSMTEKLQTRLLDMYKITGLGRYFELLEQISDMQVSTIDSFFKRVISNEGSALGYGSNVELRSFVYEKKNIIREVINDIYLSEQPDDILDANILSINDMVNTALWAWDELHSRGYFLDDIYTMDFGIANRRENSIINEKLKGIIIEAEKRYQNFKKLNNAFAISDIKADMDALARNSDRVLRQKKFKFLFVDEFQDTDNSQIRSIAWMKKVFGCQLFVVGDVKQSIYRFRGAEETAFDELKEQLKLKGYDASTVKEYNLIKNYRTSPIVMEKLNSLFRLWGKRGLLTWEADVEACINKDGLTKKFKYGPKYNRISSWDIDRETFKEIKELMKKSHHITVLCRSNKKVKAVSEYCRKQGLTCVAVIDGGFYKSKPVRDFYALLGGLLYPDDPRRLYNFILTPYISFDPDIREVIDLEGHKEGLLEYFKGILNKDNWECIQKKTRIVPFFSLVSAIFDRNPLARMAEIRKADSPLYVETADPDIDIESYVLNLNKLMQIIYDNFSGEHVSVLDVFNFLDNKIKTDSGEDLVYPDLNKKGCIVEAMTVHKAKGLEFDAVIVSHVSTPFIWSEEDEKQYNRVHGALITDSSAGVLKVGWKIPVPFNNELYFCNDAYLDMKAEEEQAVRREEARLLYVALTRTERYLTVFVPAEPQGNTWGEYLYDIEER